MPFGPASTLLMVKAVAAAPNVGANSLPGFVPVALFSVIVPVPVRELPVPVTITVPEFTVSAELIVPVAPPLINNALIDTTPNVTSTLFCVDVTLFDNVIVFLNVTFVADALVLFGRVMVTPRI